MKIESTEAKKEFKPFSITITFETERECKMVQALTNNSESLTEYINESSMDEAPKDFSQDEVSCFDKIWHKIYDNLNK